MIEDLSKTLTWTPGKWKTRPSRTDHPTLPNLPASNVKFHPTRFVYDETGRLVLCQRKHEDHD